MTYNYYPATYQPYYQPNFQMVQQPQQTNTNVVWCQGIESAKAWAVAPNTTMALWDSESQTIYVKTADASGMPTMKILDYTLREPTMPSERVSEPKADYLTRADLDALYEQISDLRDEIDNLSIKRSPKRKEIIEE